MNEMTREKLCARIGLPFSYAQMGKVPEEKERFLWRLFEDDEKAFYQALEQEETPYQTALYLYVKWGAQAYASYKEAGISDEVYYDSFRDLEIWCDHCIRETGRPGMKQYTWTSLPLKRKIYRLGRLQYEPGVFREPVEYEGRTYLPGNAALEVHIPEGEPLDTEKVEESFARVRTFFTDTVPFAAEGFFCESWLLSPKLKQLLPEGANILRFQANFFVYGEIDARQAEERVFGKVLEDIRDYPEETSLQKSLKQYLEQGGKVGMGCGFIPF